jgi:hypothetical protein
MQCEREDIEQICFYIINVCFHVGFHDCGDTITAGRCATLKRLRQAIRYKRPGLLRQDVIILQNKDRPHTNDGTQR